MKKYVKQIASFFMAITMLFSITAGVDFSACAAVYGEDIVAYARQYIGCRYEYASQGPDSFDCSGFVHYVFAHFGISMPTSTSELNNSLSSYGKVIATDSVENAQAGDVILWYDKVHHVAIYTENGHCVEAANSKAGVRESEFTVDSLSKYNGSYRVIRIYGVQPAPEDIPISLDYVNKDTFSVDVSGTSALIKWSAVENAQGYEIRLLSSPKGEWKIVGQSDKSEYFLTGLTTSHNYSIQIRAYAKSVSTYYSPGWSYSFGFRTLQFDDIENYPIYDDYLIYTSVYNDFIKGTNPPDYTHFSPDNGITRGMLITILYRMADCPYDDGRNPYEESPFTDISDASAYYYNAACWALDNGITTQTTFKPNDDVSREQTASFLFRYAKENNMLGDDAYINVNLSVYHDYDNIRDWSKEAMQWANYNGMITGTQQGYANPQGSTLRIHATKILYGFGKTCNIGNFE